MITITKASLSDIDIIAPLFDAYRVFYKQESDILTAKKFISDRLHKNESTIFLARSGDEVVGFTQIYPVFSSVTVQRMHILNDLFVNSDFRGKGIATLLLNEAKHFAVENGSKGLGLETAHDNPAQALYERLGWEKDDSTLHYFWKA